MKINKFTKSRNGMYIVTLEDNSKVKIHEDLILKHNLLITKNLSEKEKEEIYEENKTYEIYEVATSYINKKLRSVKELEKYLKKKEYSNESIEEVITLLKKNGFLDDSIYAKSLIHDKIVLTMDGPNKIKKELEDNNISYSLIEELISEYTEDLELERIEKIADKQIKLNNN